MSEEYITTKIYLTDHTYIEFFDRFRINDETKLIKKTKKIVYQFVIKSLNSVILYLSLEIR
jgi:hypothetical protein